MCPLDHSPAAETPPRPAARGRWRRWLRRAAIGLGALTILLAAGGWYGYQQNWDRYIHYRRLPDWRRADERRLIRQLAAEATQTAGARPAAASPSAALTAGLPGVASAATPAATPTVDLMALPNGRVADASIQSPVLGKQLAYRVYLPPGYDDPRFAGARYPVLYLLHGAPGGKNDWVDGASANQTADALIKMRRIRPVIIVMPDGSLGDPRHDTQWGNSPVTGERVEDALIQDLIPAIDATYRTLPNKDDRAIGGLSAGGYGAVNIALHHPDEFTVVFSMSGYYLPEQTYDGKDIWGDDATRALNTPLDNVGKPGQQGLHIQIIHARNEPDTLRQAQEFARRLTQSGIDNQLLIFDGNGHSWEFWRARLLDALTYEDQFFARPGGASTGQ